MSRLLLGRHGGPEALVLDLGSDVGALILNADESRLGREGDLTAAGQPRSHHLHTLIRRRRGLQHSVVAGVDGETRVDAHTLWGLDGLPLAEVNIVGGQVTEIAGGSRTGGPRAAS